MTAQAARVKQALQSNLRVPRIVAQWHEHLAQSLTMLVHVGSVGNFSGDIAEPRKLPTACDRDVGQIDG